MEGDGVDLVSLRRHLFTFPLMEVLKCSVSLSWRDVTKRDFCSCFCLTYAILTVKNLFESQELYIQSYITNF